MEREYYILWYRLDKKDSYLIWFSTEDKDGVFVNESQFVPSFQSIQNLQSYAENYKIVLIKEQTLLQNFDTVKKWLIDPNTKIENYNPFLNTNTFAK